LTASRSSAEEGTHRATGRQEAPLQAASIPAREEDTGRQAKAGRSPPGRAWGPPRPHARLFVTISDSTKEERVFQRVTVKQANITSIHQSLLEATATAGGDGTDTEEVALAFRQMTIENVVGSTVATDSSSPTIGDSWSNAAGGGTGSGTSPGGGATQHMSTQLTKAEPRILSVASTTPQPALSSPPGTKSRQPTPVGQEQIQRLANLTLPKWGRLSRGGGETLG
jgi:hypothetical protein